MILLALSLQQANWGNSIRILEDHPNPLPRCERCGSQVTMLQINNRPYLLENYKQGEDRCIRRKTLQRCFEASRVLLHINKETLPPSEAFPYLGWKIAYNNSDWVAVYLNLRTSWRRWGMIVRVLERTGATVRS